MKLNTVGIVNNNHITGIEYGVIEIEVPENTGPIRVLEKLPPMPPLIPIIKMEKAQQRKNAAAMHKNYNRMRNAKYNVAFRNAKGRNR